MCVFGVTCPSTSEWTSVPVNFGRTRASTETTHDHSQGLYRTYLSVVYGSEVRAVTSAVHRGATLYGGVLPFVEPDQIASIHRYTLELAFLFPRKTMPTVTEFI